MERESSSDLIRDHEPAMQRAQIALRWARSASLLLWSQKSSPSSLRGSAPTENDAEEEKQRIRKVIEELRMEMVRERVKTRKVKLCGLMELVLQVVIPVSLVTFAAMIVFGVLEG